ncbi:uncharacterized protein LOC132635661 [Lycium barbarum]|uniref:uncharacterized protein LOC132635661 n=1 Tax=Lycium barbarum TaxID=112863 RepID=UPI00293E0B74|nr:uncharacterized protein LOC132635661 [Lycium barbarum]XP_060208123.1 uncharacterized protein LOC132635661 [Lycium barbarum]XP_060208124.1 uncharacterized protein LOC132635661 [Lycium barbarum]
MDEMHQEDAQAVPEDDPATTNCNISSTSRGDTHEFTQASAMTYQPTTTQIVPYMTPQTPQYSRDPSFSSFENIFVENGPVFNSSPVQMSIDIPEATNRDDGQDCNIEIQGNELDDSNDEVDGEPSMRQKRKIIRKRCATGSHFLDQHGRIKKQRCRGKKQQGRSKNK